METMDAGFKPPLRQRGRAGRGDSPGAVPPDSSLWPRLFRRVLTDLLRRVGFTRAKGDFHLISPDFTWFHLSGRKK